MNENKKKFLNKKQRFILTFIGNIVYSIGIFLPFGIGQYSVYITSYLHHYNSKVNLHFGNLMMPILILFLCLSAPIGGILERKFGMKLSLIINSIISSYLAEYLVINPEKTKLSLFEGTVELQGVKFKKTFFATLNLPYLELVEGYIGKIFIKTIFTTNKLFFRTFRL